ncbi:hypothetical protein ACJMK2_012717 [Sinanodonta woodiana]|uniref:HAT C-terminal dimerisation domain-containing protein n=1 Tax=Sinanodonta woodiana TaxID=1069815 RepID=A0ABD3VAS3_SINWO
MTSRRYPRPKRERLKLKQTPLDHQDDVSGISFLWPVTSLSVPSTKRPKWNAVDTMIELYMASPSLPREDLYSWWNTHKFQFPYLAKLARRYLSAPASSVPSEQLFSGAGQTFSDRCGSLLGEKGEMLLLLKYNLPQLGFQY